MADKVGFAQGNAPRVPGGQGGNGTLILGPGGPIRHGPEKNGLAGAPGHHVGDKEGVR